MARRIYLAALAAAGAVAGFSAPAAAFQFENGTIWPLAVGINGGPAQVVPAEDVAFLFRGQCPNGCQLNIAVADPARAGTVISGAAGQPTAILGNGDPVIVRVRQERGGITVEVVGDATASLVAPPTGGVLVPPAGTLPATPPTAPVAGAPQGTVPALTPPPPIGSPPQFTGPPPATTVEPSTTPSGPSGFVPPPPPPEYSN
ncbi:MAG: hypothetical protein ACFCVH_07595 [Alphaproteobacteria bacterium]